MFDVFRKTLRDKWAFIFGWSLGLVALAFLMVIVYPSFNNTGMDELLESLPEALRGLVGDLNALKELPTYLASQLFDIRMPIFISILAIVLALGLTVSEEEKGQLRTLVALPIGRTSIVLGKWLAAVVICVIASIATLLGVWLSIVSIGETIDVMTLLRLVGLMCLMIIAMVTLIFGIGLATGNRALTMTVAIVLTVGSFIVSTFAAAVDWMKNIEGISLFYYYPAVDIARGTVEPMTFLVYGGITVVALVVAIIFFRGRDVKS